MVCAAPESALTFAVAACCTVVACSDWRDKITPGLALAVPEQKETTAEARRMALSDRSSAQLTPRARYVTRAWVVATDDDFDDPFRSLMPIDLALTWGTLADSAIL